MIGHAMRAILLASAMAATLVGRRSSNAEEHVKLRSARRCSAENSEDFGARTKLIFARPPRLSRLIAPAEVDGRARQADVRNDDVACRLAAARFAGSADFGSPQDVRSTTISGAKAKRDWLPLRAAFERDQRRRLICGSKWSWRHRLLLYAMPRELSPCQTVRDVLRLFSLRHSPQSFLSLPL